MKSPNVQQKAKTFNTQRKASTSSFLENSGHCQGLSHQKVSELFLPWAHGNVLPTPGDAQEPVVQGRGLVEPPFQGVAGLDFEPSCLSHGFLRTTT